MRQVCVIGLGLFGTHLAETLAEQGVEVLVVDRNRDKVSAIKDRVATAVVIDAKDKAALEKVIPSTVDAVVVSLGESVEASVMCTLHLKQLGYKQILAKATSRDHMTILEAVGAHKALFPEQEMARRTARTMINPNFMEFLPLPGDYRVDRVAVPDAFDGHTLIDLGLRNKYGVMILAVERPSVSHTDLLPTADYKLSKGDDLVVAGRSTDLDRLEKEI